MGAACGRKWKGEVTFPGARQLAEESGTLGGLIKFKHVAQQFGLSNHHVFFGGKDYDSRYNFLQCMILLLISRGDKYVRTASARQ